MDKTYEVSAGEGGQLGVAPSRSFRVGSVKGRVGDVVELTDEQVEQLRRSGFVVNESDRQEVIEHEQQAKPEAATSEPDNTEEVNE